MTFDNNIENVPHSPPEGLSERERTYLRELAKRYGLPEDASEDQIWPAVYDAYVARRERDKNRQPSEKEKAFLRKLAKKHGLPEDASEDQIWPAVYNEYRKHMNL